MNIIKEKKIINLNSEDATIYNNGSFLSDLVFNFKGILKDERNILYTEGGVLNAQIPVSFYQVAYYNNTLYYSVDATTYNIVIPVGNYNFSTFSIALSTAFLVNGHTFNITISETTGKLQFNLTSGGTSFIFLGASSGTTIFKILGFDPALNYPDDGSNNLTAPYLLNLLGPKKLKILSSIFSNDSNDSTSYITSNLISTISVDAPSYGLIVYNNLSDLYGRLKVKRIDNIDIQIKDEYGNFINFNNTDFSITLTLIIYRKIDITNNDLSEILNTLQNIESELAPQPDYNQPIQEDTQITQEETSQPNLNEMSDLDLLLYENPKLFN